jgi:hypothetical protein
MSDPGLELAPRSQAFLDRTRWVAAVLGFGLAAATIGVGYAISEIPIFEDFLGFRFLFEPGGAVAMSRSDQVVAWLSGPIAAAVCGWFVARRAARGDRWAGPWMGAGTFVLAITVAVLAIQTLAIASVDIGLALLQLPVLVFFASAVLAPLLVLCVLAGSVWAAAVRRVVPVMEPIAAPEWPASLLLVLIALALIAWAAGASIFLGFGDAPADFID